MNKNSKSRNGFIHLYNPKKEGLGSYDFHYINALRKSLKEKQRNHYKKDKDDIQAFRERASAWSD